MLRSKDESDGEPLSVTILNTQQLPNYSSERSYILSELDIHGHSTVHLSEDDHEIKQMKEESSPSTTDEQRQRFASYIILYLFWRPDLNPRVFAETILFENLKKLEALVDIVPSREDRLSSLSSSFSSLSGIQGQVLKIESSYENEEMSERKEDDETERKEDDGVHREGNEVRNQTLEGSLQESKKTGHYVYVVVDRCCPTLPDAVDQDARQRHFQVQVDLAEKLARMVASHSRMRIICEGITVGVADQARAAPGLEACLDAILFGAKDRRRHSPRSENKSWVGLVTASSEDLQGPHDQLAADATQGLLQCRVRAEWLGKGTLISFAQRSHKAWRVDHDLPPEEPSPTFSRKRKRGGALATDTDHLELSLVEVISTVTALCFWVAIASYVWQNWKSLMQPFLVIDDESSFFYRPPDTSQE